MQNAEAVTAGQVRKITGATRSRLRYWETNGIVHPTLVAHASRTWRLYPAEQVDRIRTLKRLLDDGYTLRGAVNKMDKSAVTVSDPIPAMGG